MKSLLNNLYLFKGLSDETMSRIEAIAQVERFSKDAQIFQQGEVADSFFVIQYGSVNIELDNEDESGKRIVVATLGTGSHFGEMAFLDDEPRSAYATAATDCDLVRLRYREMNELLESDLSMSIHVYRELARFLCSRLRLTTLDLGYERSQILGHL